MKKSAIIQSKRSILVVDDDSAWIDIWGSRFSKLGYKVLESKNYLRAVKILDRESNPKQKTCGIDGVVVDRYLKGSGIWSRKEVFTLKRDLRERIYEAWAKGQNYQETRSEKEVREDMLREMNYGDEIARTAKRQLPNVVVTLMLTGYTSTDLEEEKMKWSKSGIIVDDKDNLEKVVHQMDILIRNLNQKK